MKTRILLVDDDHQITRSLQLGLKYSFDVRTTNSIESAQAILSEESFDVVVTDVVFHGSPLNGLSLIEWMESKKYETPIIVMSGESTVQQVLSITNRIEDAFLLKPLWTICAVLSKRRNIGLSPKRNVLQSRSAK
jgi:two-component system nitrogen regulation response regulator NtrX